MNRGVNEKMKYLKVMFGNKSLAGNGFQYKIGEVNIADYWNPKAENPKETGGFNYSTESKILRWLVRGDTIYDVTVPEDAEVVEIDSPSAPGGVFRTNKIILTNPRPVTDELAMELYTKSDLPEKSYFKALTGCAIRGNMITAIQILKDKVNKENINIALEEFMDFCSHDSEFDDSKLGTNCKEIYRLLLEIKKSKTK